MENVDPLQFFLHEDLSSPFTIEQQSINTINKDFEHDWSIGIANLPQKYHQLFIGTLTRKLQES